MHLTVDAGALPYLSIIAAKILGHDKCQRMGGYLDMLNPHRDDRDFGSFRVDLRSGKWWEFANSAYGFGASSLVAYLLGVDKEQAAGCIQYLLRQSDIRPACLQQKVEPLALETLQSEGLLPSSSDLPDDKPAEQLWDAKTQPAINDLVLKSIFPGISAQPSTVFEYRNAKAEVLQRVVRWNAGVITWAKGKVIKPLIFAKPLGEGTENVAASWVVAWAPRIPLWNAPDLAERPGAPVLWVEGESAAATATKYTPAGVIVATAAGGLLGRADWSSMCGRNVVIWPDADEPGRKYAERVAAKLRLVSARSVIIIPPLLAAPKGWDLADNPLDAGTTETNIRRMLSDAFANNVIDPKGPDMSLIERIRVDLTPAPSNLLPSWRPWAADVAAARDVEPEGVLLTAMTAASGLMAGVIEISPRPGWFEPAAMNTAICGPSGSRKTPLLDAVIDPIRAEEKARAAVYKLELDMWKADCKVAKIRKEPEPAKPVRDQLLTGDSTPDAFAVLQSERPCGITEVWPEGSSLISSFTRYSSSGSAGGLSAARAMALEKFDSKRVWYNRRKIGEPVLSLIASSMLTTLQPDVLTHFLGSCLSLMDGLDARWLFYYPTPRYVGSAGNSSVTAEQYAAHETEWRRGINRIYEAACAAGLSAPHEHKRVITLTLEAGDYFESWRRSWLTSKVQEFNGDLPGAIAKIPGYSLRLALAMHVLEWAHSERSIESLFSSQVSKETIEVAIATRSGWLEAHRARAETEAGTPTAEKLATTLARYCVVNRMLALDTVTLRRQIRLPGLRDDESILAAYRELQACGWLQDGQLLPINLRNHQMIPAVILKAPVVDTARRLLKLA